MSYTSPRMSYFSGSAARPALQASPSVLLAVTHTRMWNRLMEIVQRLNVVVDVADANMNLVLAGGGLTSTRIRAEDAALRDAAARAVSRVSAEELVLDGTSIACFPISSEGHPVGILMLTRERPDHHLGAANHGELGRMAAWMATAVEASLPSALATDSQELFQLSALLRLLNHASAGGSERQLMSAFIEALAVWEDIESWAYRAGVSGTFSLDAWLPGSEPTLVPSQLQDHLTGDDATIVGVSAAGAERLGFHSAGELAIARVRRQNTSHWLIAASGAGDRRRIDRLALYVDILRQAFCEMRAADYSRLTWAMLQHLLREPDSPTRAAEGAIAEASAIMKAPVRFAIWRADGSQALSVGDAPPLPSSVPVTRPDCLIRTVSVGAPYIAAIGACRSPERPFSSGDEQLLDTAASAMSAWLVTAVHGLAAIRDRRRGRSFDDVVEQHAKDAEFHGPPLSLVVIRPAKPWRDDEAVQSWIGSLRTQLRATDLAGRLTSGEIGILLLDTAVDGAHIVAERARQMIASDVKDSSRPPFLIGVASRSVGLTSEDSLISQAQVRTFDPGTTTPLEPVERARLLPLSPPE
jgi:hypothetical protein